MQVMKGILDWDCMILDLECNNMVNITEVIKCSATTLLAVTELKKWFAYLGVTCIRERREGEGDGEMLH